MFCHVHGRGKNRAQMVPGWPYSVIAALEPGRTSWTAVLDVVRLGPDDDETTVTATQVREVVGRLQAAGHWQDGDPDILLVFGDNGQPEGGRFINPGRGVTLIYVFTPEIQAIE